MPQKMSPTEFQQALAAKTLRSPLILTGLAKEADDNSSIMFSPDDCLTWIRIPLTLLEEIEFLGEVPCKDHSHPLVRLNLKRPSGDESVFAELLEGLLSYMRRSTARPVSRPEPASRLDLSRASRMVRRGRGRTRHEPVSARAWYNAGCRANCYDTPYAVFTEGEGSDCNNAWDACFSDLDYECA